LSVITLFNPVLAEDRNDLLKTITLSEALNNKQVLAQANNTYDSNESFEKDEDEERVNGFYFPLAIGGQQFSGFDINDTINEESYNGSLNGRFGFSGETGLGYKLGNFRTEVLYGYSDMPGPDFNLRGVPNVSNEKTSDANMQTLTFGLLYDIDTNSKWTPYVGGKVGAGWLNLGDTSFEVGNVKYSLKDSYKSQSALVYGGKIGLAYQASRELDLFMEGAYQRTGNYSFGLEAEGKNQRVAEKDETVTTTQTQIVDKEKVTETPGELFLPNETVLYIPIGGEGGGVNITCGEIPFIFDEVFLYKECFKATEIEKITDDKVRITTTTTKVIKEGTIITSDPDFGSLDFSPGNGWSLKVGFRWFFNQPNNNSVSMVQNPAPDPVFEVQSESIPVPVRALW
jgi:hypothetical protein